MVHSIHIHGLTSRERVDSDLLGAGGGPNGWIKGVESEGERGIK